MNKYIISILIIIFCNISFSQDNPVKKDTLIHKDTLTLFKDTTMVKDTLILNKEDLNLPKDSTVRFKDSLTLVKDSLTRVKDSLAQYLDSLIYFLNYKNDSWNLHLFRVINYNRSKVKDAVLPVFSRSVMPMVILFPVNTFLYGRIYDKTYDENTGYLLAASEVANFIFTFAAKMIFKEPRPFSTLKYLYKFADIPIDPFAFPSAHTSFSFTVAATCLLRYPKYPQLYLPIYLWSFVVAYSRPYLGMHYPVDVLTGMGIGTGSAVLMYSIRNILFKFKNNVLGENKNDEGSINGGLLTIFLLSHLVTDLLTSFVIPHSPLLAQLSPFIIDKPGISLTLNYKF